MKTDSRVPESLRARFRANRAPPPLNENGRTSGLSEQMLTTVILWIVAVLFLVLDLLLPTALWLGGSWEDPFFVIWQVWWWAVTGIPLFAIAWVTWFVHLIWAAIRARRFKQATAPGARGSPR